MGKNVKMAKTLSLILALALCLVTLAGCSDDKKKEKKKESNVKEETTDKETEYSDKEETEEKMPDAVIDLPVNDKIDFTDTEIGDIITFGRYEQDNDTSNGKEDIEWIVIGKEDGKLFLMSKYALDCKKYNEENKEVTWETCTLRTWLNDDFLNTAFTPKEQQYIATTEVKNEDNVYIYFKQEFKVPGGNNTHDKIFLLSINEAKSYFKEELSDDGYAKVSRTRSCFPTEYAKAQGINTETIYNYSTDSWSMGCCKRYWLRSPGESNTQVSTITYIGKIDEDGSMGRNDVDTDNYGVRPVMWVNITS